MSSSALLALALGLPSAGALPARPVPAADPAPGVTSQLAAPTTRERAAGAGSDPAPRAGASMPADAIVGEWWTQDKDGRVEFLRSRDGTYRGVLRYGSRPRKDVHNPNPKLRERSIIGIVLVWNLRYDDGEYVDGFVYNPEDGDTYRLQARLSDPRSLEVRGFLGISLLGKTHTWTRYR